MEHHPFHLRVKIGEVEVELSGERDQVLSTLDDLDQIVLKINSAINGETKKRKVTSPAKAEVSPHDFPTITRTSQCGEAVISLLSTEWGETPRTIGEIREAMEANAIFFPKTTISGVLVWLVKKGQLRRWKDKKKGYLYVINELEGE